jgi:hypothetical protein
MENLIENIKASIWTTFRNIRILNFKSLFCRLGFHKMIRGVGWSGDKRLDVCLHNKCNYTKWHKDKIGNELIRNTRK